MYHSPFRVQRCAIGITLTLLACLLAGCHGTVESTRAGPPARVVSSPRLGVGAPRVELIVEPDDGLSPLARAVRAASNSIDLTMYLLTNKTIVRDLEYAHAYGVRVRVILEPHPYGALTNPNLSAYNNLMAADIPVRWASPRFRLTHEKSMVVDGTAAYIMTTNFTRSAFRSNREFDVVDHDRRDVAAVQALFAADWSDRPYVPRDPNLPLSPSDARPLLTALVTAARRTLDVYAEELQDVGMEEALVAAARRGARVRIILPAPSPSSAPDADAAGVARVTAAGGHVHRLAQASLYIHAKAIVADGQRAFVGSQNLSATSLDANRELGIIVADRSAINAIEGTFAQDWGH